MQTDKQEAEKMRKLIRTSRLTEATTTATQNSFDVSHICVLCILRPVGLLTVWRLIRLKHMRVWNGKSHAQKRIESTHVTCGGTSTYGFYLQSRSLVIIKTMKLELSEEYYAHSFLTISTITERFYLQVFNLRKLLIHQTPNSGLQFVKNTSYIRKRHIFESMK
jgi:hypothetical protein